MAAHFVRRRRHLTPVAMMIAAVVAIFALTGGTALAYWATTGSGTGIATTGTLNPPTAVTVPATSGGAVSVSWTASTGSPSPTGYYVTRTKSDNSSASACGTSPTAPVSATSCTDSVPTSGSYTYKVTALYRSWSSPSASSGSVAVTIATATKLAFTTQPTNTTAGAAFAVAVTVQDAGGVAVQVPGRSVSVAIGTNPGSATLSGTLTATTDASGVATFNSLSINKVGTGYTLSAASSGLTAATSAAFNISVGSVTALAFTTQPSNATGGVAFTTQPVVKLQDASGNNVGAGTNQVTLSLTAPANGATLSCANNSVNAVAGTATFSGCKIDLAGTYSLTATSGTLAAAQSNSISVTVGPATSLVFSTQPSGSTGGTVFATQPTVKIVDAGGNTTTATSTITLALTNSSSGATLTCTGGLSKAAAGGVAAFAGCKIDKVGTYTLSASASSLNGATSNSVVITTGAAAALCFVGTSGTTCLSGVQTVGNKGTFSGRVQLVDLGGNPVAATTAVTVSLSSNGDLGVPSPGSVTIAAASSVSGSLSDAIVNSGGNSTGVLTGSSSGLTSATVTIHA